MSVSRGVCKWLIQSWPWAFLCSEFPRYSFSNHISISFRLCPLIKSHKRKTSCEHVNTVKCSVSTYPLPHTFSCVDANSAAVHTWCYYHSSVNNERVQLHTNKRVRSCTDSGWMVSGLGAPLLWEQNYLPAKCAAILSLCILFTDIKKKSYKWDYSTSGADSSDATSRVLRTSSKREYLHVSVWFNLAWNVLSVVLLK